PRYTIHGRLNVSSIDKLLSTTAEDFNTPPTPPLTRPPSLEHADVETTIDDEVVIVLSWPEDATSAEEEQHPQEVNWVQNLVAAVLVAVRFLTGPTRAGARQRCPDKNGGDDRRDGARRASLWRRARAAMRDAFGKAVEKARDVKKRVLELFDDPIARAARLVSLAKEFVVRDMPQHAGHKRHNSDELFERDQHRLGAAESVATSVKKICFQMAAEFPEIGYNQARGFDAACRAILLCVGGDLNAAVQVFCKWAVPVSWLTMNKDDEGKRAIEPAMAYTWSVITRHAAPVFGWLSRDPVVGCDTPEEMAQTILEHIFLEPLTTCCSRLGLTKRVMDEIIEETIKAGVHGPAVTIFVVMSLLCLAEKRGADNTDEVVMMKVPLKEAAKTVSSFKALEKESTITLEKFLIGYRDATADTPACGMRESA
ncbi:unnamed protein product, partial [Hapterophycus canaliculatus]